MTDEAAQSRDAAGSSQDAPAPSAAPPAGNAPPWFTAPDGPTFSREQLIRPARGRYIAGVCAAIARATNTDPVLWRVLLAVLGFFGGVGVLVYLLGWLLIPAEGDTASPVESLLGRGRSAMAPLSVVLLGATAVLTFAFIVRDGFRATLLATAVLLCGALVLRKSARPAGSGAAAGAAASDPWAATATFPAAPPAASGAGAAPASGPGDKASRPDDGPSAPDDEPTTAFAPAGGPAPASAPAGEPVTAPLPPMPPLTPAAGAADAGTTAAGAATGGAATVGAAAAGAAAAGVTAGVTAGTAAGPHEPPQPPRFGPPSGGFRPPFAPHGPWAQGPGQQPHGPWAHGPGHPPQPPQPAKPPKPPKPPRERSKLGRITFFGVVVVMGVLALFDLSGAPIPVSGYFAAALATIALGLIVGAWFGRARGLIFLAVLATLGLSISSGAEEFGGQFANNSYRPQSLAAVADRYDFTVGTATLDLRALDFTGHDQAVTVAMKFGQVRVLLPDKVDASTSVSMNDGRAVVYGKETTGHLNLQGATDLGPDGAGGGNLRLTIQMEAGNVEVTR
ncbi:PspC domain-containing protein [Couchioplanes azureus]|uniref:PspC domain-containing protein n=1 Tax=Couchioplanes caeruleus TaxID=56438 RepID=UPI00166FDD7E|nr:PspC domain-containing protein [Couchioplanes caeruleus]GGQ66094.1 hypothetical protein GCM10010166_39700 [Couchioplanes caeruleus subsp. azureus]